MRLGSCSLEPSRWVRKDGEVLSVWDWVPGAWGGGVCGNWGVLETPSARPGFGEGLKGATLEQLCSGFLSERSWGGGGWRGCWFGVEVTSHHWGAPGWAPMGAPRLPDVAQRGLTARLLPTQPPPSSPKPIDF